MPDDNSPNDYVIVKVGGSLFDLPDLADRLRAYLTFLHTPHAILIAGGGKVAKLVRDLDHVHHLGEEKAHWLAVRSLALTARFLAEVLPEAGVSRDLDGCVRLWSAGQPAILDPCAFVIQDEGQPGCLPHSWDVTSDSIAARVAELTGAELLVLLKSIDVPEGMTWREAGKHGFVDPYFAQVGPRCGDVQFFNLRSFSLE